jgi:two-component sensor histidine kinase/two-component SAPR family response regulator
MYWADKVNLLLVDDQPAKLLSYEVILQGLGENLIKAMSGREALEHLLKTEIAVVLVDVSMPDLDGFQLASMIRAHPRYEKTAIIFVSAVFASDMDRVRGYEMGAVDYVPVPVIPEVLRAKVRVFVDLYRKNRELERLNDELEHRVRERTAELEAAIERQSILAREVDHRAKNALAVVQSILRLTRAKDLKSYTAAVEGRISALSRAHALLSHTRWEGASLGQLVEEELAPYLTKDAARISARGPAVMLQPVAAQTLALAIHELATNAAKYGALSVDSGRVRISWELKPEKLELSWEEIGGPAVQSPSYRGFGIHLISASIEGQLRGTAKFEWRSSGLSCMLCVPRSEQFELPHGEPAGTPAQRKEPVPPELSAGKRVLLAEDEALVAMMMSDLLGSFGLTVLGPYSRVADAVAAATRHDLDLAVLDINLGGELVYPVAEMLTERGVPFVFVTGYGSDRVDKRFALVPVLQKPIQPQELQSAFAAANTDRSSAGARHA